MNPSEKTIGPLVRMAREVARVLVPTSFWPVVDDELRDEIAERHGSGRPRWRCDVWGAFQYLAVGVRLGVDRLLPFSGGPTGDGWRGGWALDIKQAARALRRRPAMSATVLATVVLAVGATTAVYSVVDAVLMRPLPYADSERLARVWETRPEWVDAPSEMMRSIAFRLMPSAPAYYDWREAETGFSSLGAYVDASFVWQGADGAEVLRGQEADAGLFETLGVDPILGRTVASADDEKDVPDVVVLSEPFWRQRFAASPAALGRVVSLNGVPHTVVGVMPAGFQGPAEAEMDALLPTGSPDLWTPLTAEARRGWKNVSVVARLGPEASMPIASERLRSAHEARVTADPDAPLRGVRVEPLLDSVVSDVRSTLWFLLAAVGLVLVVATVNIANVLTALGLDRRRELAVRAALGAGSGRLVRSLFVESALLAVGGGLGGIVLAWLSLPILVRLLPPTVPRQELVGMSPAVLLCGIVVTGLTALLVGSLPAVLAARADPQEAMRSASRGNTSGPTAGRVRSGLVVAEVSLAVVLLVGAGLLGSSYARLTSVDRGFVTEGVAAIWVEPDPEAHSTRAERDRFAEQLRAGLQTIPGVRAAAANNVPLSGLSSGTIVTFERPGRDPGERNALLSVGMDNYLDVLGVSLLSGRGLAATDGPDAPHVSVVNKTLADTFWPGEDPIGMRLQFDGNEAWTEIVGVVSNVRHQGLALDVEPKVYLPALQSDRDTNEWLLRSDGPVGPALQRAREVVATVSPSTPVTRALVIEEEVASSVAIPRFRTLFIVALAALAGVLALLGVYGVLTYTVLQRSKEICVRMALGARAESVVTEVVGSGLRLAAAGVGLGLLIAWGGADYVSGFLFEIVPTHPITYLGVALGVLTVGALAAYLPARRAASIDPVGALGSD